MSIIARNPMQIKKQFLSEQNYRDTKEANLKMNGKYDQLCDYFISRYRILNNNRFVQIALSQNNILEGNRQYEFIMQLKRFITDFSGIICEISRYQMQCIQHLKEQNVAQLQIYERLTIKNKENLQINEEIQKNKEDLTKLYQNIRGQYLIYKQQMENTSNYYDKVLVDSVHSKIGAQIKRTDMFISAIANRQQLLQTKIDQFQPILSKFKCKLVKNKYTLHKKISTLVQNSKFCMIEKMGQLKQCGIFYRKSLKKILLNPQDDISSIKMLMSRDVDEISIEHHLDEIERVENAIKTGMSQYLFENEKVEKTISEIILYFNAIGSEQAFMREEFKRIMNDIDNFYEEKESLYEEMFELSTMLSNMSFKFSNIIDRLKRILQQNINNKNKCKKHFEIILSLLKIKRSKKELLKQNGSRSHIQQLINSISFVETKQSILQFYQSCIMSQNQLLEAVNMQTKPRRKTLDSMDISHSLEINKKYLVDRKKPLKSEIWLWKDWKEEAKPMVQIYTDYFGRITGTINDHRNMFNAKDNLQMDQYDCKLVDKEKMPGTLKIMNNCIQFNSQKKLILLPWKQITLIQKRLNFFVKSIVITTVHGSMQFTDFTSNLEPIIESIQEAQQKSLMGNNKKVERKKQILLSPTQIQEIKKRREKIASQLPKLQDYKLIVAESFENQRIDQVYEYIYSDKPFDFYGKQQACFFTYTGKKAGNLEWTAQKYDKPGPEFYTLKQGISFSNCALFSTRKIAFKHPMKPSSIPFMPKVCDNKDERRMYWVSHQQLLYSIKSYTFNVPYSDYFYVEILHRITKVSSSVKIEIFSRVVFVKQTSLKNVIFSSTDPQIDENMQEFMKQIRKLLKMKKDIANGQKVVFEQQKTTTHHAPAKDSEDDAGKLKLYNKILIGGVILLFLLNLIKWV